MRKFFRQKNKAFTLVETLVALAIFSMSVVTLMVVLGQGIGNTTYAKNKMIAAYLAQEGIEYVRNMRDTSALRNLSDTLFGWGSFRDSSLVPSLLPNYSDSSFTRTITKTTINADEIKISSTVYWNPGSGTQRITFSEDLFNWIE